MIETEEQRRWWFATHPEYSGSRKGQKSSGKKSNGIVPEKVDEWVDERLKYEKNPVTRELLRLTRKWFGTEGQPDGSSDKSKEESEGEARYGEGWKNGY